MLNLAICHPFCAPTPPTVGVSALNPPFQGAHKLPEFLLHYDNNKEQVFIEYQVFQAVNDAL